MGTEEVVEAEKRARRMCGPEVGDAARAHCEFVHRATRWKCAHRVVCRVLATRRDERFIDPARPPPCPLG